MSLTLKDLVLPADLLERYGRKEGWHGDTHHSNGRLIEEAKGKPRVVRSVWYPTEAQGDDLVDELHIIYDDGVVVKVPAEEFRIKV